MHTFLKEQPQLNVHESAVQDALLGVARFWLERGVDGFRLDALNHSMHDPRLRNNPPAPCTGRIRTRPFDFQIRRYSQSQPGVIDFIERIRALCDEYGAIHTVAEVGGENAIAEMKAYTRGDRRLNSAYGFDLLYAPELTSRIVAETLARWSQGVGWPSWAFENHDAPRAVSRWCATGDRPRFARMKMALLAALRGNIIVYQGEELGLEQDEIPFELLQDPEAVANWPLTLSRDGARTPMPWTDVSPGGFTTGTPWLPLSRANLARSVDRQEGEAGSQLALTRELLALRRHHPALRLGTLGECVVEGPLLSFERSLRKERIRCLFNLSPGPIVSAFRPERKVLFACNGATPGRLPAYGALYLAD
jgi:alpha-glucosidase